MPHWRSAECHVTYQPLLLCPHPHRWLVGAHPVSVSLSAVGEYVSTWTHVNKGCDRKHSAMSYNIHDIV